MRIYISAYIQFSIFSSGHHVCAVQLAHELKSLGHDVTLVNILDNNATWFDDCKGIAIPVIQRTACKEKADLLIDVIGCTTAEERAALANKTVLFIRQPPIQQELENVVYPAATLKRCYDGISEIWTFDFFGRNDYVVLGILGRCPVRTLPFIWSPIIVEAYCREAQIMPWYLTADKSTENHIRICETNVNNRSNCTIPLIIMREYMKRSGSESINSIHVSNAKQLQDRKFFMENIYKHIDILPQPQLEGRSRLPDWTMNPRPFIVAHERFQPVRWAYLDAAYLGIPMVHNSDLLRLFGGELEKYYYSNNEVGLAATKLGLLLTSASNEYTEDALKRTRYVLVNGLTIRRDNAKGAWTKALTEVGPAVPILAQLDEKLLVQPITKAAEEPAAAAEVPVDPPNIFRVQFVGMWENFQADYNFFTLMLGAYFKDSGIRVIGCGPEYLGIPSLRVLGPFGCSAPVRMGIPTVFTTSENTPPLAEELCRQNEIKLQLGFSKKASGPGYMRLPLWMMSIDWFGADNNRLVNPKVMSLEACIKPHKKQERDRFCAFVVTNPGNPKRNAALDLFNTISRVDSAGRYMNNIGSDIFAGLGGGGGEIKKVEFLENYRWNITYENSMGEGYVTEKLFHAKVAGCLPVYWGDAEAAKEDFDGQGFIIANDMTDDELVKRVRWLESEEGAKERLIMAQTPLFSAAKANTIRRHLAAVAHKMVEVSLFKSRPAPIPEEIGIKPGQEISPRKVYGRSY